MCGIFGYIGKNTKSLPLVIAGIKTLEYRGYDSWGVAYLEKTPAIHIYKRAGKIEKVPNFNKVKSNFSLGHTRWATHGGVTDINAHPHLDCTHTIALIHNGIIENYDEIKRELIEKNHIFISDTDTEVAVHLIEEIYKKTRKEIPLPQNPFLQAVRLAFNRFVGMSAIIAMDASTRQFVAAKNGSPLAIGKGIKENFLASDAHAMLSSTREIYFMDDNEVASISDDKICSYDSQSGRQKNIRFTHISWEQKEAHKGRFEHFMLKEIYDQPHVIESIIASSDKEIETFAHYIKKSYGTYLVGCGTAAYACLAGTYIFSQIAKRHVNFTVGSEFAYSADFITPKSLVIALSQSGETIDVIDAVKNAKQKKATITTIVNVLGSTLYRLADHKLLLGAGTETAVVSTKAFTAKLAYLILLAFHISGDINEGKNLLKKTSIAVDTVLQTKTMQQIKKLVDIIYKHEHIYVIGRGISYPIALETALKIKEASYIHAEGFAAGELKHGVIALITPKTPCIAFLPNDETYGATLAGAMEMRARGGYIIGISYKPHEIFDYYLPFPDCGIGSIIPEAVIGQLLGYYLAVKRGCNPDKPRNLAKSVTVK